MDGFLLESGDRLLIESGDHLLLEELPASGLFPTAGRQVFVTLDRTVMVYPMDLGAMD